MSFNFEQERVLEHKYQGVLNYVDAKHFLDETPYTAAKINSAIKRFCNADGAETPKNFIDMELFVNDLADFWLDANPEAHDQGEHILHESLSNYIAFAIVWKHKSKSSGIYEPELMAKCGAMIVFKNTLGQVIKIHNSCVKRNPVLKREEIANGLIDGFALLLPMVANSQIPAPKEELTRLVGAYMAGNEQVLQIAGSLMPLLGDEA